MFVPLSTLSPSPLSAPREGDVSLVEAAICQSVAWAPTHSPAHVHGSLEVCRAQLPLLAACGLQREAHPLSAAPARRDGPLRLRLLGRRRARVL
eukprot:1246552-Pleurochrysis_carterae.AAC.1